MIKLSVIIVSYINIHDLENCINSIYKYNDIGSALEVIIVDNSPDLTLYNHIKNKYNQINIIKNDNTGFGAGNNIGANNSNGEYILFLNPDTILIEPIFKYAINVFKENPQIGMFGVKLLDEEKKDNFSFSFMKSHFSLLGGVILKLFNRMNFFIPKKMFTSGANIFIPRKVFFEIGMFDENLFMYFEEKDLIKRLIKINKTNAFFKNKRIIHLEGQTTAKSNNSMRVYIESMYTYYHKYSLNFELAIKKEIKRLKRKKIILHLIGRDTEDIKNEILITKQISEKILEDEV